MPKKLTRVGPTGRWATPLKAASLFTVLHLVALYFISQETNEEEDSAVANSVDPEGSTPPATKPMATSSRRNLHDSPLQKWRTTASTSCDNVNDPSFPGNQGSKLIFLGSGSSTGCPRPLCPLLFSNLKSNETPVASPNVQKMQEELIDSCRTSNLAMEGGDPASNKNYRNNPSFLISFVQVDETTGLPTRKNVVIDVGKTFREGALRWLPKHGIRSVDSIVLTHQHMDAAGGLDDVRGFQQYFRVPGQLRKRRQVPMPIFLSHECLGELQNEFPWLLPKPKRKVPDPLRPPDGKPVVNRHVASFDVTVFQPFKSFEAVPGLFITPLPVMHGEDLVSFGFSFSVGGLNVVYLSDISRMLPETLDYIRTRLPQPTHMLVLDALLIDGKNAAHYNLKEAVALVNQIEPKQTYLVGMNCDSFLPHDQANELLQREHGGKILLAHDGLVVPAQPSELTRSALH